MPSSNTRRYPVALWLFLAAMALIGVHYGSRNLIAPGDESTPRIQVETGAMAVALTRYKSDFGSFPAGDSRAICRALTGENAKRRQYILLRRTPDGDILDPWGTPYRIYFCGDLFLIRSAGPNQQFDSNSQKQRTDDFFAG